MGNDRVSADINRDGAYLWKALRSFRTQANLLGRRCAFPGRFSRLWRVPDDEPVDRIPSVPGFRSSRIDANRSGCDWRPVHATRTRQMAGSDRGSVRPVFRSWPDSRRVDYGQLHVALGVLCQPANWYHRAAGTHLLDAIPA